MRHIEWLLTVIICSLPLFVVIKTQPDEIPVHLLAFLATIGWLLTKKCADPITGGLHTALGPLAIGLLLVSFLVIIIDPISKRADLIGSTERSLVWLNENAPKWTKPSPEVFVAICVCLLALDYSVPNLKLTRKFISLNKLTSKTIAVLGTVTSFTFFSNVAVKGGAKPDHCGGVKVGQWRVVGV
jgi:hypothetical protein